MDSEDIVMLVFASVLPLLVIGLFVYGIVSAVVRSCGC